MADYGCEDGQKMQWIPDSWQEPGWWDGMEQNCERCKGVGCDLLAKLAGIEERLSGLTDEGDVREDALTLLDIVHSFQKPFLEREYEREERYAERAEQARGEIGF